MKTNSSKLTGKILALLAALSLLISSCGSAKSKTYVVGVIVELPWLAAIYDSFKVSMTELGYVEGQNITYLYNPEVGSDQAAFDAEAQRLMDQKVDLFFTIGTLTTKAAQKAVEGTNIPVVFTPVINPVAEGVVKDIAHPGGNVTGVQIIDRSPKALEWALKIAPQTKHIYMPYNPADAITMMLVNGGILETIPQLGLELEPSQVSDVNEMLERVDALPEDTIIFLLSPISSLETGLEQLSQRAQARGIPIFTINRDVGLSPFPVANYTVSIAAEAQQGARMVDRIFQGQKPADMPIETAEYFLQIDLKTAQIYNLPVSDEILSQADTIIR